MRDETETLNPFGDFWSRAQFRHWLRERVRAVASVGFVLAAVASIHFNEQMSPALDRIVGHATLAGVKTMRNASIAFWGAALPFFLRG